jgi:hypothetical protein
MSQFALALKSTLDKAINDLATANGLVYLDLDGAYMMSDLLESQAAAIAWSMSHLVENPADPLYHLEFDVGGKTSEDPAQYVSLGLVGLISSQFRAGSSLKIMDYSGAALPTEVLGEIYVTASGAQPAQFDRISGYRLVHVTAKAVRWA